MSTFQARFKQSPAERKRYVLDYTLFLAPGENIVSVATAITQNAGAASPPLVINGMALLPQVNNQTIGAAYFCSGGVDGGVYEVQFLATTSIGQVLEDIVQYTLQENL
jgi:hypothetical protein